jgi:uncharacterized membrane protein YbjE (DUF340 family)
VVNLAELIGDLFLVIFPITMVIGYLVRKPIRLLNIGSYLQYIVMILVFTMALWAGNVVSSTYVTSIVVYAVAYALVSIIMSIITTMPIGMLLRSRYPKSFGSSINSTERPGVRLPIILLAVLVIGWLMGYYIKSPLITNYVNYAIVIELLALIIVVGLDIGSSLNTSLLVQGSVGIIIGVISILGSAIGGLIMHYIVGLPLPASLGISMGMGWYSLAGPLLSVKFGPTIGTLAFLANFLREQFTYLIVPLIVIGGFRDLSLISVGGATAMDDTLPIYKIYMGEISGFTAFISGFVITMMLPILLPYVMML